MTATSDEQHAAPEGRDQSIDPAYDLVIFDFDGTLANTSDWFKTVLNDVADKYKFRKISDEEYEHLRGQNSRAIMRYVKLRRWKIPFIAAHLHDLLERDAEQIPLFDGVTPMLRRLKEAGITLCLVTSNSESNVRKILGPERSELFDHFSCGASLFGKSRHFKKLIKRLDGVKRRTLAVGDEIRDLEAARKAGIKIGLVGWGYADAEFLESLRPDHFFRTMDDVSSQVLRD